MGTLKISLVNDRMLAIMLTISMLVWGLGLASWIGIANAAMIETASDTLLDSDLSALTQHTIVYTTATEVAAAATINFQLDPDTDLFSEAFSAATTTDITIVGSGGGAASHVANAAACSAGANELYVSDADYTAPGESITFTTCAGDTLPVGTYTFVIGAVTNLWTNPAVAASYIIRVGGTQTDSGDIRVAIIDDVAVSATVPTSLTFTVAGVASGVASANGGAGTTDVTTTATTIPWGTLAADTAKQANQNLTVATNATNGFTVTVYQDGDLTNGSGDTINLFDDGVNGAAKAWEAPGAVLDSVDTYGHQGITSEDSSLVGGDTFAAALYDAIGTSASPLEVFYHTGPADGATAHKGATQIGFSIEVDDLQEPGNDYAQVLTYVATPIF